jgi:glycosyltransferase involved in cell wall biosynthesis
MRILLLSSLYGIRGGGAGILVYRLARGLSTSGNTVSVATMGEAPRYTEAKEQEIQVYRFRPFNIYPFEEKDTRPVWQRILWQMLDIYNLQSARIFRQILEKEAPDIVHIHKMRGFSSAVWSVAADSLPGRVIQTCHDYESMSPDGILRGSIGRMALRRQWPVRGYQIIRARLSAGVSVVTAPNAFTLHRIKNSGLFPRADSRVVANSHGWTQQELKAIHRRFVNSPGTAIKFLYLGRLEPEKGIDQLCTAFLRVHESYPSVQLKVAGWGTLDSALREKYSIHHGFNFLGVVDGIAKEDALNNANVVVLPSVVDEVFPLTIVEAFAFGKPVIASAVGGIPELVKHGETGWLVQPGDIESLAQQMRSVARMDSSTLAKMSQACKEFAYQFSMEKVVANYLQLYDQLLRRELL